MIYLDLLNDDLLHIIWIKVYDNVIEELKNKPKNPNKRYSYKGVIPSLSIETFSTYLGSLITYDKENYEDKLLTKQKEKNNIVVLFGFVIFEFANNLSLQEHLLKECRKNIIKKNEYYIDCLKDNNIKVKKNMKKVDMIKMLIKL